MSKNKLTIQSYFNIYCWSGVDIKDVQEMVEKHLQELIIKSFDARKADTIFNTGGGEVSTV